MSNPPDAKPKMIEIGQQAEALVAGRIGICAAARRIRDLSFSAFKDPWAQPELKIFLVIDSETDDLPVDRGREHWDPGALKKKDEEIARVDALYRGQALQAAQLVLADPRYQVGGDLR